MSCADGRAAYGIVGLPFSACSSRDLIDALASGQITGPQQRLARRSKPRVLPGRRVRSSEELRARARHRRPKHRSPARAGESAAQQLAADDATDKSGQLPSERRECGEARLLKPAAAPAKQRGEEGRGGKASRFGHGESHFCTSGGSSGHWPERLAGRDRRGWRGKPGLWSGCARYRRGKKAQASKPIEKLGAEHCE